MQIPISEFTVCFKVSVIGKQQSEKIWAGKSVLGKIQLLDHLEDSEICLCEHFHFIQCKLRETN